MNPNFYAAIGFDRAAHRRKDTEFLTAARAETTCLAVLTWRSRNLAVLGEAPQAFFPRLAQLVEHDLAESVFLGETAAARYFALDLSRLEEAEAQAFASALAPGAEFVDLRKVGPMLPHLDGSLLAYAKGLAYWHERHRFCGVCGAPTRSDSAGHVRVCTGCGVSHFPRTDPATIMLVIDGPRCLLARHSGRIPNVFTTLAGFVEPGESLEDAVAREVFEETGVRVSDVRYQSSQPWPFPASLMVGFHATAATTGITIDPEELSEARWFTAAEVRRLPDEGFTLPRPDSIARRLVETWLATQP